MALSRRFSLSRAGPPDMAEFLTFALVAPLAAFGALAVGERRESWNRPGRSAVLGLLGACLGVERNDEAGQGALAEDYGLSLLCAAPGHLLADFHTAQTGRLPRGGRFRTRREELQAARVDTTLSRRDYRVEAWHLAVLWSRAVSPRWSLADLAEAMQEPRFTPYLGRKSCPLGLPLAPRLGAAESPADALRARWATGPEAPFRDRMSDPSEALSIAGDPWTGSRGQSLHHVEQRRDQPLSRTLWQFALREEVIEPFAPERKPS